MEGVVTMHEPLDKDALDFLDSNPDAKQMVKEMLAAVVDHPDIHMNSFRTQNVGSGNFDYFLGLRSSSRGGSPFLNHRQLKGNIVPQLIHHHIAGRTREPNQGDGWYGFTDAALEWHRVYGGAGADEVRKKIGRLLQTQIHQYREFDPQQIARQIGVSAERVRDEATLLLAAGLIEIQQEPGRDYVRLAQPAGIYWSAAGFPPVGTLLNAQQAPLPVPVPIPRAPSPSQQPAGEMRDVFISHASEDKDDVARPLADALIGNGLHVWFDEYELRIGDSLRRKIDTGLVNSRYGVVILSESFFAKSWPQHELDGMVAQTNSGTQDILPIWHKISKAEVMAYSPSLADKVARSTTAWTIEKIAAEIAKVVKASKNDGS
jgi:hypothetical protein